MALPPFLRRPGIEGSRFSGVFNWKRNVADLTEVEMLGTDQHMMFASPVPEGTFTVYEAVVLETEPIFLGLDERSKVVPYVPIDGFNNKVKEICAGMGGIGLGCMLLHGQVLASLDCSALSCMHLQLNQHGHVLHRDLHDDHAKGELHVLGGVASTLTAGFPCQPHSTQGFQLGSADPRHGTLTEILRTAYLHMTQCLILECTPQAQFDATVRQEITALAKIMNWTVHEQTLALSHQWPCRRHRWWVVMCPSTWTSTKLLKWPMASEFKTINSILPGWGLWSLPQETELQLTVREMQKFADTRYGNDKRLLELGDTAPTFLHSYGSALMKCPCMCRHSPFSEETLPQKGLRGCFVISRLHGQPRYLHPLELFALHGVPLTVTHVPDLRAAMCLVGQLASPLQALWVFSCLNSLAQGHDVDQTLLNAQMALATVQRQMVRDHFYMWKQPDSIPRHISVRLSDGESISVLSAGLTTVAKLLRAETFNLARGEMLHLSDGSRILPDDQILLEHGAHGPYCIQITQTIDMTEPFAHHVVTIDLNDELHLAVVRPGSFLFQAHQQCGLDDISYYEDEEGRFFGPDYRVWGDLRLLAHPRAAAGVQQMAFGLRCPDLIGLSDTTIWTSLVSICQTTFSPYDEPPLMIPPSIANAILSGTLTAFQGDGLRALFKESNGQLYCIFAAKNHWALLCGSLEQQGMTWTYFDGYHSWILDAASQLAWTLSWLLQIPSASIDAFSLQPQQYPHTCGTLAIMHLCLVLGLDGHFAPEDELLMHQAFTRHQVAKAHQFPLGKASNDLQDRLATFLEERGVPADASTQRATDAIRTLGASSIQEAFQASNPWATLKGLASRPNTRFRWVKKHELKDHIEQQARKKHGAQITKAKQKKQSTTAFKQLPQVDPTTLRLLPDTFIDGDGDEIQQIDFTEVGQDATGLAFCTYQDAKPFIEAATSISTTTLGLLINTEVPMDFWGEADLSHLQFPALCSATDEPLILRGTLLNLSDGTIQRKERQSPNLSVMDTDILKVQIYQDEIAIAWQQVTAGPVRALLQLVPSFRLCPGRHCGKDCGLFHAPVGETLPGLIMDIWARGFYNNHGKSTKAEHAHYFQVMLRVPTVALDFLLRAGVKGVYIEPRSSTVKGPHGDYCVVWLAGHDRDQAIHKLRTGTHGIAIARLHQRFGVRVPKQFEKQAHAELRPDDDFVDVEVKQVYTAFPLPFGLQRSQMVKLLAAWGWAAKPLQPIKGNLQGQAWTIGATEPPPNKVMPGFDQDILITLQKDVISPTYQQTLVASTRTKKFLKEGQQRSSASSTTSDPWLNGDPWSGWQRPSKPMAAAAPTTASRFSQIQDTIKDEIQKQVQQAPPGLLPPDDIKRMEVNIAELQAQGTQFKQWFQEAGNRMNNTEAQLGQLRAVVEQQGQAVAAQISEIQQEVDNKTQILQHTLQGSVAAMSQDLSTAMDSKLNSQLDRLEAMLAKKARCE